MPKLGRIRTLIERLYQVAFQMIKNGLSRIKLLFIKSETSSLFYQKAEFEGLRMSATLERKL
jgi:hypothetical protein